MSRTAVITGATSGIGAVYARRLAVDGYDLVITGRRREIIQNLANNLVNQHNIKVDVIIAELSDDDDIQKVIDAIKAAENIDILINNAGYSGPFKEYIEVELQEYEQMIKVHQIVPMRLISAVVPQMIRRGGGTIINVASNAAYAPMPKFVVYGGTKAFSKYFSEGLYQELRGKGIKVQALCPGFIDTDFSKAYLTEEYGKFISKIKNKMMSPEAVVDYSLKCLKGDKVICIPGAIPKVMAKILPSLPRNMYYKIAAKMVEV